jgi:GT2 family glycosyltransferase
LGARSGLRDVETPAVSVTIVTHNSRGWIGACLDSALAQEGVLLEVVIVDNASTDGTQEVLEGYRDRVRVIYTGRNMGYAAGQNLAIESSAGDWILTLNPDVLMRPDFARELVAACMDDPRTGAACGKLLRIRPDFTHFESPRIDSTGIYFTGSLRHFDRGWNDPDDGRYDRTEYVCGASGAAALYRRRMIEDVSLGREFFDEDFFAYREDADVAWRAQVLGWRCVYTPRAVGWHVRRLTPETRRKVSPAVNMHSVKNRFLMRIKNATGGVYRRHWREITWRDIMVLGGCIFWEQSSLEAFPLLWRGMRRALGWRREIMQKRQASDRCLEAWFGGAQGSSEVEEKVVHRTRDLGDRTLPVSNGLVR